MKPRKVPSKTVADLKSHVGFWLRLVSNHVSHGFAVRIDASGVTVAEWVILREMFDVDVTSARSLAGTTGLTPGAISKLIDRLYRKKLLTRTEATEDRRFQDVSLTRAGRELVPRLAALADENDADFFSPLSAEERSALVSILKKLAEESKLHKLPMQ